MTRSVLAVAIVLVACRGAAPRRHVELPPLPVSPAGIDRAVLADEVAIERDLADRACACADEACLVAVDDDYAAYEERATMNDPVTHVETWPSDLDAMSHAAHRRMVACMVDGDHSVAHRGIYELRRFRGLRDAACACDSASCALRVGKEAEAAAPNVIVGALPPEVIEEIRTISLELRACIGPALAEQAILDLKALRADACKCTDRACAVEVAIRVKAWSQDTPISAETGFSLEMREVSDEISACLVSAAGATSSP